MAAITGSLTATGSVSFTYGKPPQDTVVIAAISGTYGTVTFVFEGTLDGTEWFPIAAVRADTYAYINGTISPSDNAELMYKVDSTLLSNVRARVTAIASGTVTFTLQSGSFVGSPFLASQVTNSGSAGSQSFTGDVTLSGGVDLIFDGTTGQSQLLVPDNLASALKIGQSAFTYATIVTTNSADAIRVADSVKLSLGDADDIGFLWDATDLLVSQATTDSNIKWGVSGAGINHIFYGDTATANMTWDQTNDQLLFNDNAYLAIGTGAGAAGDIRFSWDATRMNVTQLTTNSEIRWGVDGAGIDQMWYGDTASAYANWDQSADALVFGGAAGITNLKVKQSTAVAITGATTLVLADSGGIFTVGQGSAYDIDLPSPTTGAGATYVFSLTAPAANAVTITVAGSAATFVGTIVNDVTSVVSATGSTLTFASGALLGDTIIIRSIATNLYHVQAVSAAAGGITIA